MWSGIEATACTFGDKRETDWGPKTIHKEERKREKQRKLLFTIILSETLICCVSIAKEILKLCKPWM